MSRPGILALLAALLTATGCCPPFCSDLPDCPKAYRIAGEGNADETYNILILGDGFRDDEQLKSFRSAAEELANKVLSEKPLCKHRKRIGVYRIDVMEPSGSTPVDTSSCPSPQNDLAAAAAVAPCDYQPLPMLSMPATMTPEFHQTGPGSRSVDLETHLCWYGDCESLWLTANGQTEALELAACVPNLRAVVVLANANNYAGGGLLLPPAPGDYVGKGFAVVGVPSGSTGLTQDAPLLLSHEMGHALGLLDEHTDGDAWSEPPKDRNVWLPANPCWQPWGPVGTTAIPWKSVLTCNPEQSSPPCACETASCKQPWVPQRLVVGQYNDCCPTAGAASAVGGASNSWKPELLPAGTCGDQPDKVFPCSAAFVSNVHNDCLSQPGFWEGAVYKEAGAYRARDTCRMNDPGELYGGVFATFCDACTLYLDGILGAYGGEGVADAACN